MKFDEEEEIPEEEEESIDAIIAEEFPVRQSNTTSTDERSLRDILAMLVLG